MKLMFCDSCSDVFKLDYDMRTCKCGRVKGRYLNSSEAEVSEAGYSIGIGNGSLMNAIMDMKSHQRFTNDKAERHTYYVEGNGLISHAWVRPNTGSGNPHTKIIKPAHKKGSGSKESKED